MTDDGETITRVSAQSLRELGLAIMARVGIPAEDAEVTIDSLVEADLRGVHSHGMMRVPSYVDRLLRGGTHPRPQIRVVAETAGTAVVDGDGGLGQVVSKRAMEIAIAKARATGVGVVGARNSHHFGACAYWAEMALPHDMVGMVITSGALNMAPWGALTPSLSNDPIGVAIPAGQELPIVLDMATSVVAGGKFDVAIRTGEKIPFGWALTLEGEPTDDPREARQGLLLPLGGYKGYALTVVFEVLAAVLVGANFARHLPRHPADPGVPMGVGHFFQAIDIAPLVPVEEFKARVDDLIRQMKSSKLAPGHDRIYLPGEPEFETRARNLREGIPMPSEVIRELQALAQTVGVEGPAIG